MAAAATPAGTLTDRELSAKIDRYVALRPVTNEHTRLGKEIAAELAQRGQDAFAAPSGASAALKPRVTIRWLVEKLKNHFSRNLFEQLCPRAADTRKLNQRFAACPEDRDLAKCRQETQAKPRLEVLGAGEAAAASDESED